MARKQSPKRFDEFTVPLLPDRFQFFNLVGVVGGEVT